MTRNKKITITTFVIALLLMGVWLSLDSRTKNSLYQATLCKLIYGKNICNFYAMMDTVSSDPENSDFDKAMQLCGEMEDVPKKDSCFEYIAQVVSFYDTEKAKEACEEIKEFDGVHSKEDCYNVVGKSKEERLAESAVVAFMEARLQRDEELALSWLTENAKEQYLFLSELSLVGLSNPYFVDFEILEREELTDSQFTFRVRIYEEYTGRGKVGFFDETLTVIKSGDKYLIDSVERSQYTSL
jgi:hypothetical protein